MNSRILIIEDSPAIRSVYCQLLVEAGHEVFSAASAEEALAALPQQLPLDLALVDYSLPNMSGEDFLSAFKDQFPQCDAIVVIISSYSSSSPFAQSVRASGGRFMEKPNDIYEFVAAVQALLDTRR